MDWITVQRYKKNWTEQGKRDKMAEFLYLVQEKGGNGSAEYQKEECMGCGVNGQREQDAA